MSKYRVVWSDQAFKDLQEIHQRISEHSFESAQNQVNNILNREHQLETYPLSGTVQTTQTLTTQYRYLVEGNFKIIYQIQQQTVFVDTVFDTRQDPSEMNV